MLRERLIHLLLLTNIFVLVITLLLFGISLSETAGIGYQSGSIYLALTSSNGVLCLDVVQRFRQYAPYTRDPSPDPDGFEWLDEPGAAPFTPETLGFNHVWFGMGGAGNVCIHSVWYVPYWAVLVVLAIYPGIRLRARLRNRRARPNLCTQCGYDLRAHVGNSVLSTQSSSLPRRCPECGTPIPAPAHQTK